MYLWHHGPRDVCSPAPRPVTSRDGPNFGTRGRSARTRRHGCLTQPCPWARAAIGNALRDLQQCIETKWAVHRHVFLVRPHLTVSRNLCLQRADG